MSLNTNALITVDELLTSMGTDKSNFAVNMIRIYNSTAGTTSATVTKTSTNLNLTVVGGANAHNNNFDLSNASYDTLGELITGIEALSKGWVVNLINVSAQASVNLFNTSQGVLLEANEYIMQGFDELLLEQIINAVSQYAQEFCRRKFHDDDYTEYYDGTGKQYLRLEQYPVNTLTTLKYYDYVNQIVEQTFTNHEDYELYAEEGMIYKPGFFQRGHKNYEVVYNAGYTTIPDDLKQAATEMCKWLYSIRDKAGVKSERIGRYAITFTAGSEGARIMGQEVPAHIINLFAPYIKLDVQHRQL